MSLAHSAQCLGQVSASLAQLVWPAAVLPLSSHSAAPEVSNMWVQQNPQHANGRRCDGCLHNSFWLSHSSGSLQGMGYLPLVRASSAFPPLSSFLFEQCLIHLSQCTGYYCPVRSAVPLPCPEGTLNTLEGALAPTACKLCPVGRYCRGDANWEPDGEFG